METQYFLPVETILYVDESKVWVDGRHKCAQHSACSPLPIITQNDMTVANLVNESTSVSDENDEQTEIICSDFNTTSLIKEWYTDMPTTTLSQSFFNNEELPMEENSVIQLEDKPKKKFKIKRKMSYRRKNELKRIARRIKNQDPTFRAIEREKRRYQNELKRLDPVFCEQKREKSRRDYMFKKMKSKRTSPILNEQEREKQSIRMFVKRLDPEFREKEREQQRARVKVKRLDPAFQEKEREQRKVWLQAKRQDPKFREREKEQQRARLQIKRQDPEFKEKERIINKARIQIKRMDPIYREREREYQRARKLEKLLDRALDETKIKTETLNQSETTNKQNISYDSTINALDEKESTDFLNKAKLTEISMDLSQIKIDLYDGLPDRCM